MSEKISTALFLAAVESQQKFDYFVTGLSGAIFAYMAQTYKPQFLDYPPNRIEPLALFLLFLSIYFGLKRIETSNLARNLNYEIIDTGERAGGLTSALGQGQLYYSPDSGDIMTPENVALRRERNIARGKEAEKAIKKVIEQAQQYYNYRNLFLEIGFLAIILGKLLEPYR